MACELEKSAALAWKEADASRPKPTSSPREDPFLMVCTVTRPLEWTVYPADIQVHKAIKLNERMLSNLTAEVR